jgi:hypothetical protein
MSNKRVFETNAEHVYPVESPDLSLDFINSRGIDPAYTFTRNSSATYVGPDGLIKTAAVNQPRFDFDPVTGECKGLLIEMARTNSLSYSTTFNVAWTDTNITRNTTTALAPDGTNSALRVTAGNDNATIIRNSTVGSTNTRTFSIYLRRVSGSGNIQFTWDGGPSWPTITQPITDKWSRFILFTNFTNHRVGLRIVTAGDSIELWGSQLEVGVETSYIPTTTTTVTRQPDQLVLNKPLNTQGTLYVESRPTTGVSLVADNGSSSLSVPQNPNQYSKSILYYNTDRTLTMSSDGGVPVDFSSFLAPSSLNRVSLGFNRLNNSSYINGHLKKFSYYSSPLTEDNLRALTGNKRSIIRLYDFGGPIVTSGLVLNLDAGNPASYPGSGTTWTDLSGNGNNGTLVNGVGYSGDNLGSLSFDGVNDYAQVTDVSSLRPSSATISIWFKCLSTTGGSTPNSMIISKFDSVASFNGWGLGVTPTGVFITIKNSNTNYNFGSISGTFSQWTNFTFSYISNSVALGFINGTQYSSRNIPTINVTTQPLRMGISVDTFWAKFNGNIAQASIYNRALTAAEIQQNFNALRNRFGI